MSTLMTRSENRCKTSRLLMEVLTVVCETSGLIWARHVQICFDISDRSSYFQNDMNDKLNVIHRDIKSANILRFALGRTKSRDIKNVVERNGTKKSPAKLMYVNLKCNKGNNQDDVDFEVSLENFSGCYIVEVVLRMGEALSSGKGIPAPVNETCGAKGLETGLASKRPEMKEVMAASYFKLRKSYWSLLLRIVVEHSVGGLWLGVVGWRGSRAACGRSLVLGLIGWGLCFKLRGGRRFVKIWRLAVLGATCTCDRSLLDKLGRRANEASGESEVEYRKRCETSMLLKEVVTVVCETTSLIWARHVQIWFDISAGLSYLQNNMNDKLNVIHRDIKSANFVMDDAWNGLLRMNPSKSFERKLIIKPIGQSMKKQYRHFKNRIKAQYFSPWESVEEAKRNMPPEDDRKKYQADWEKKFGGLIRSEWKNREYVKKGRYQDLITHWRDRHSQEGIFDNSENEALYARMKSIKDQVNARNIEFKSAKQIIADVTKSTNREHEPGVGKGYRWVSALVLANEDYCTREQITEIIRQEVADKESPPPLPTTLVPGTIPDPYSDPNRYYKVINPGSSRIPNDEEYGDDQDGNDEDGNGNNEDGNGNNEPTSSSDDE
ncbi:kinase-like domain, phloem protein 2-like protein [Tanacetum coccineum]